MTPKSEMLEWFHRFEGKRGEAGIDADICIGPDWLSVATINRQLPDMPNNLPDFANVLHYTEDKGDEKGERFFGIGGYMTCTLSKNPSKAIGCLNFRMNLYHVKSKELRIYVDLEGVSVAKKYRRRYIASTMGLLVGQYIAEKISAASQLLNYKEARVVMMADFNHEGGEACFAQMEAEIESCREAMFPDLEVDSEAGW